MPHDQCDQVFVWAGATETAFYQRLTPSTESPLLPWQPRQLADRMPHIFDVARCITVFLRVGTKAETQQAYGESCMQELFDMVRMNESPLFGICGMVLCPHGVEYTKVGKGRAKPD